MFSTLPKGQQEALFHEQNALELQSIDIGIARYRELRKESDASVFTPEQRLITSCMATLVPGIEAIQRDVIEGKPRKRITKWGLPILSLSAEKLALITLVTAINMNHAGECTYTKVCLGVAGAVKAEREFSLFKKNAPDLYKTLTMRVKRWDRPALRRLKVRTLINDKAWPLTTRVLVGAVLCQALVECTDAFEHKKVFDNGRTVGVLLLKPEITKALEQQHSECELLKPFLLPMVVPPIKWVVGSKEDGGYHYRKRPLVKSGEGQTTPQTPQVKEVLDAINAIQETPFAINKRILEVQEAFWKTGGGVTGIPYADPCPLPPRPADIDSNEESKKGWIAEAAQIHRKNAQAVGQRHAFMTKLWIARTFSKYPVLYFPVEMDWRGRVYPIASQLHPQTDDVGRALLMFAEGKPLGKDGYRWLTIHLANCLGYDKLSFEQRIAEVEHQSGAIEQWVDSPLVHRGWLEGSDPWLALAAAQEWVAARKDKENFVSHIPVSLDGSCNGLQHFAAMGRDLVGGRAVNLVPSDTPQDIYRSVAAFVNEQIEKEYHEWEENTARPVPLSSKSGKSGPCSDSPCSPSSGEQFCGCLVWRGKVTRNTVKRAVMTTPYGVTPEGIRRQFIDDGHCDNMENKWRASNYLKNLVYDAVGAVVVSARQHMDYLQTVSKICGEAGLPVEWVTPDGLKIRQEYLKTTSRRVVTMLQEIHLRLPHPDKKIEVISQVRGSSPNFVHSIDAAHLRMVVLRCLAIGITGFLLVHDSYGTHAADVTRMGQLIRQVFVEIYSTNLLLKFKTDLEQTTGLTLPELPPTGQLNIADVLNSPYAFH